jgi:hypothetical protein
MTFSEPCSYEMALSYQQELQICAPYINQLIYDECARQWSLAQMASNPPFGKRWKMCLQFNIVSVWSLKWRMYVFVLSEVFKWLCPFFQNICSQVFEKSRGQIFFFFSTV